MQASRQIAQFRPTSILQDLDPTELPADAWSEGENIQFIYGNAHRIGGDEIAFDDALIIEPRHLVRCNEPDGWLVVCENACVFRDSAGTFYNVTPTLWQDVAELADAITDTQLNEFTVINHATDVPYWKSKTAATILAPLTGYSSGSCAAMRAFKEHLFALGVVSVSTNHVKWSASGGAGLPTVWTPGGGNDAGDAELSDTPGLIIDGAVLGANLIIYKESSCYICSYVGGNAVFSFRVLFRNIGMFARNCAIAHRGVQLVLTQDDLIVHDGVRPESVISDKNKAWLFNQMDTDYYTNTFLYLNAAQNEAWICFPTVGRQYPDLALTWSFEDGSFGVRELYTDQASSMTKGACAHIASGSTEVTALDQWGQDTETWQNDSTLWDQDIFTQYDVRTIAAQPASSEVLSLNASTNRFDDTDIRGRVARVGLDLGNRSANKLVQRVVPQITAPAGFVLKFRLGQQLTRDAAVTWGTEQSFTVGTDETIGVYQFGRYIAIEFWSDDPDPWEIAGFDLDYKLKGFF